MFLGGGIPINTHLRLVETCWTTFKVYWTSPSRVLIGNLAVDAVVEICRGSSEFPSEIHYFLTAQQLSISIA